MWSITCVWFTSVGHRESSRLVRSSVNQLIFDVSAVGSPLLSLRLEIYESAIRRAAGASATTFWILSVWAAELVHEVGNNSVEVDTIVEAWARRRDISVFWWGKR